MCKFISFGYFCMFMNYILYAKVLSLVYFCIFHKNYKIVNTVMSDFYEYGILYIPDSPGIINLYLFLIFRTLTVSLGGNPREDWESLCE